MKTSRLRRFACAATAMSAVLALTALSSDAVTPGSNGRIAFASNRAGNNEIYSMAADGTDVRRLTTNPGDDILPAWSPDGTKIAFSSNRVGAKGYDIFVMNADGTGLVNLTNTAGSDRFPAWSRDGTKIAFMSARDRNGNFEIYTMNADGSNPKRLTTTAGIEDCCIDWGPGDTQIVFQTIRDGNFEIYTMNADGTAQTNITNHATYDGTPTWSPDGKRIIFRSLRDNSNDFYTVAPTGGPVTRLYHAGSSNRTPAWSPDGSKIVFTSNRTGNDDIWVINADGTGAVEPHPGQGERPDARLATGSLSCETRGGTRSSRIHPLNRRHRLVAHRGRAPAGAAGLASLSSSKNCGKCRPSIRD